MMNDLISRVVVKMLLDLCPEKTEPGSYDEYAVSCICGAAEMVKRLPAVDAVPIAYAKEIVDIALYTISKMEDFGCAYVWEKSGDPDGDENNIRAECQEYRRKIKSIMERWSNADLP